MAAEYKFSFGPWNISEGNDPFGPTVRPTVAWADNLMDCGIVVLWLAREGTYVREAKRAIDAHKWLLEAVNAMLAHDPKIRIAIEPKPNEPMDHAYIPTIGHALALGAVSSDPKRVGGLIET